MLNRSSEDYVELLGLLYEAPLEDAAWGEALELMCQLFKANHATLFLRTTTPYRPGTVIAAGEASEAVINSYHRVYHSLDPFIDLPTEQVITVGEFLGAQGWRGSLYYRDFLVNLDVSDMMGADIRLASGAICRLRLSRSQHSPSFMHTDKVLGEQVLPHLRRALRLYTQLGQLDVERNLYAEAVERLMIGVVLLDIKGRIILVNQVARDLLSHGDVLRQEEGGLRARNALASRELRYLIDCVLSAHQQSQPVASRAMSIELPDGRGSLGIIVQRALQGTRWGDDRHPAVAVLLRDPAQTPQVPVDLARQMFGLTGAEAAIAIQLVNGLSLDEAADALHISRNTAKTHLGRVFSKTGVSRQTELIRILLNASIALGAGSG